MSPRNSSNPYLLIAVKILFVVVILLLLPKFVVGTNVHPGAKHPHLARHRISLKSKECTRVQCAEWLLEENMNCVNQCVDQECYTEVYGDQPLEDGEIDVIRARDFERCFTKVIRRERMNARKELTQ